MQPLYSGGADGLLLDNVIQFSEQFVGVATVWVFTFVLDEDVAKTPSERI